MDSSKKIILVMFLVSFLMFSGVSSTEFEVGGADGWIVPKNKTRADMFNKWASDNRFKVGDSLRFKYAKDSVLVVSEEEYKNCKATKPQLYSNNQDTIFKLDRPGLFYFISGVSGHCERGQKMIVKVLEMESSTESPPPSPSSSSFSSSSTPKAKKSNAFKTAVQFSSSCFGVIAVLVVSIFGLV